MNDHHWSGWPGAYCVDCGIEDQTEICLAEHDVILYCTNGHWLPDVNTQSPDDCPHDQTLCSDHINPPCAEPGSNRHNPYQKKGENH